MHVCSCKRAHSWDFVAPTSRQTPLPWACRRQLGIPMDGQAAMQHLINIHFTSKELGQALLAPSHSPRDASASTSTSTRARAGGLQGPASTQQQQQQQQHQHQQQQQQQQQLWPQQAQRQGGAQAGSRAAMLYFVFNRAVVAVVVAHDLGRGEFVAQVRPARSGGGSRACPASWWWRGMEVGRQWGRAGAQGPPLGCRHSRAALAAGTAAGALCTLGYHQGAHCVSRRDAGHTLPTPSGSGLRGGPPPFSASSLACPPPSPTPPSPLPPYLASPGAILPTPPVPKA